MQIENYEREVIRSLCAAIVPNSALASALNKPDDLSVKFDGETYALNIKHRELVSPKQVVENAEIIGTYQDQKFGFVVFVEPGVICLECHSTNGKGVPEGIRDGTVTISTT